MVLQVAEPKTFEETFQDLELEQSRTLPDWLHAVRLQAYERFRALGFPGRKQESWKYLHLDPLLKSSFAKASKPALGPADRSLLETFFLKDSTARLVFLNGFYAEERSHTKGPASGVVSFFAKQGEALRPWLAADAQTEENAFSSLNTFNFEDGLFVHLPPGFRAQGPIHLLFVSVNAPSPFVYYPRVLIVAGEQAKAQIIVEHVGLARQNYLWNGVVEAHLGKSAALDVAVRNEKGEEGFHFLKMHAFLGEKSAFRSVALMGGGKVTRLETVVDFKAPNASCDLNSLALLSGASRFFQHGIVNHQSGHCQSRQLFKNILADETQAESNSLVHVAREAPKSESNQLLRSLLLSRGCRAWSRPQLKIYSEEVQCVHGSATGQLEEQELFYLQSRGLAREFARFMIAQGFTKEVLGKLPEGAFRDRAAKWVEENLRKVMKL